MPKPSQSQTRYLNEAVQAADNGHPAPKMPTNVYGSLMARGLIDAATGEPTEAGRRALETGTIPVLKTAHGLDWAHTATGRWACFGPHGAHVLERADDKSHWRLHAAGADAPRTLHTRRTEDAIDLASAMLINNLQSATG